MILRLVLTASLVLTACASKKLNSTAEVLETSLPIKMEVTSQVIYEYSDDYNVVMQINFESKDGQWVRIDSAELDLANSDGIVQNIIIGRDLVFWLQAKSEEKKIRSQNEDMAALGLLGAGAALTSIGNTNSNGSTVVAGALTVAGSSAYLLNKEIRRQRDSAQQAQWVPDTHLYSPFTIPSMSLVKRWVLINTPSGRVNRNAILKLKTVEGDTLKYKIFLAGK